MNKIHFFLSISLLTTMLPKADPTPNELKATIFVGKDDLRDDSELKLNLHFTNGTESGYFTIIDSDGIRSYHSRDVSIAIPAACLNHDGTYKPLSSVDAKLVQHLHGFETADNGDIYKITIDYQYSTSKKIEFIYTACFQANFTGDDAGQAIRGRLKDGAGIDHGQYIPIKCN